MQAALLKLVEQNRILFWSVGEKNLDKLDEPAVVEGILNGGSLESVKKLLQTLGTQRVADIFYSQISGPRINYFPQVAHYFKLYFDRHAHQRKLEI